MTINATSIHCSSPRYFRKPMYMVDACNDVLRTTTTNNIFVHRQCWCCSRGTVPFYCRGVDGRNNQVLGGTPLLGKVLDLYCMDLFDCCVNECWCSQWPLDEVSLSKAPAQPHRTSILIAISRDGGADLHLHSTMDTFLLHHALPKRIRPR